MNKSYFFPIALIIAGVVLLLNQFNLLHITQPYLFVTGALIIAGLLLNKSTKNKHRKGLLGGVFFILSAAIMLMLELGYLPFDDEVIFPSLIIALGLSNLVYYLITRKSFSNVTFGLIFIATGSPFLIAYYGYVDYWQLADSIYMYWPVLLITLGLRFLLDGVFKKQRIK